MYVRPSVEMAFMKAPHNKIVQYIYQMIPWGRENFAIEIRQNPFINGRDIFKKTVIFNTFTVIFNSFDYLYLYYGLGPP